MNNIVYAGNHLITLSNKQHCHSEWELVYCIGGQGRFGFGEKTLVFGAGELVIIPPQMHYTNHSDDGFTNIHLHIAEATLRFKEPMVLADDSEKHIFTAFRDAMYFFSSDIDSKQLIIGALGNLIVSYVSAFRHVKPVRGIVEEIKSNIMQNYSDPEYKLDKYLRTVPFSYDYLRKIFKAEMGTTPHDYLTGLRIQMAEKLLCSTESADRNISEIAYICGYSDSLYFSRVFKKYVGCSPKKYAEQKRGEWNIANMNSREYTAAVN